MDQVNINATASLQIVVEFIRGNINLEEAKTKLYKLGFDKESPEKVLMDTPRDNIVSLNKNKDNSWKLQINYVYLIEIYSEIPLEKMKIILIHSLEITQCKKDGNFFKWS